MEGMQEHLAASNKIFEKIKFLENFISLHLHRDKVEPEILQLAEKTEEVKTLIVKCNQVMKVEYEKATEEYKAVMAKMHQQQIQVLDLLIEKRKSEQSCSSSSSANSSRTRTPTNVLREVQPKSVQNSLLRVAGLKGALKGDCTTPKMYLDEYLQSPFVRKTSRPDPTSLQFLDFEVKISPEAFESIPKYMRGRETLDELTNFLDTILVPCFNEKYQLLHRRRDCIRNHVDLDLWKVYKDQAIYFPGQNFITQGDISRRINKMLDKKSQNKITMLRHLGILQEQRKAQTVCYIWTASNI